MIPLSRGLIFQIAEDAGVKLDGQGPKRGCCCPFHEDSTASAFVSADNVFFCSVCTPGKGWSAKRFCHELGLDWSRYTGRVQGASEYRALAKREPNFTATQAASVWKAAYACARDDDAVDEFREVYDFLIERGLSEAHEYGVFGVLSAGMTLPQGVASWPRRGYGLVAPLYDLEGNVVSLQSRSVSGGKPKTLAPTGGRVAGTVFADERGRALLRGEASDTRAVILGEGLTDSLALSVASPVAVLCAPGTGNALAAVGEWARGRRVLIGLDWDEAGRRALPDVAQRAYDCGAIRVQQIEWPDGAKDACDAVAARGTGGLWSFLNQQVGA